MTFGSLFAGIGGFDLGFERAGMTCKWQVEIDPFARRVLEKHWPNVRRHDDVRTFPPTNDEWGVDVICGGFPCQDISNAGKRAGIEGERSGLWSEYARIVCFLRPRFVVVENVSAILARGLGRVLGDLAACGYDTEWQCIPASAVGAPHRRDRLWIVAHTEGSVFGANARGSRSGERASQGQAQGRALRQRLRRSNDGRSLDSSSETRTAMADTASDGVSAKRNILKKTGLAASHRNDASGCRVASGVREPADQGWWATEPAVGRVADGVPNRVHRLRGLGNAVVPQVAEWIGRRLMECQQ
jgi:DNA (cytosine-5)-methyltransferase 1